MNNMTQTNRKWLTISSVFYTIFAFIGAGIAIAENRPSEQQHEEQPFRHGKADGARVPQRDHAQ